MNSLDWNPNPFNNTMLVVASDDHAISIWEYFTQQKQWRLSCKLLGHTEPVMSIAWAPHLGYFYFIFCCDSISSDI